MIRLHISRLPGGQQFMIAELQCDGCKRRGAGPIGDSEPLNLFVLRTRLRISARMRRGWDSVTVLEPDGSGGGVTHRIDRCPACRALGPALHRSRP